jgi:hypothetical protein
LNEVDLLLIKSPAKWLGYRAERQVLTSGFRLRGFFVHLVQDVIVYSFVVKVVEEHDPLGKRLIVLDLRQVFKELMDHPGAVFVQLLELLDVLESLQLFSRAHPCPHIGVLSALVQLVTLLLAAEALEPFDQ